MEMNRKPAAAPGRKTVHAFTLVEMVVSIGVFAILILSLSAIFSSGFHSFGAARELERNDEVAQYAMNSLAKYLRTSSIVSPSTTTSGAQSILFFDYSSKRCFQYRLDGASGALQARWKDIATITDVMTDCSTSGMNAWVDLTTGWVTGRFEVVPSQKTPQSIGRVVIFLSVGKTSASSTKTSIQTAVSLRDYDYVLGN
ncbi:MAG TPA: type II secretion system protein [Candidatus Fimivivens sp.]|nr:type II secretion system protein [Candidatus Fimivivens sp.]